MWRAYPEKLMTDPYQQNPWNDSTNRQRSDPYAPASPYAQPGPYAQSGQYPPADPYPQPGQYSQAGQYPQYGQPAWNDPAAPPGSPPPPAPFVSPDTPSYAAGSSPVPMPAPAPADYGYGPSSAPSYGYAAGYGGYGSTPTYVPVMPQQKTNGMAIGSMVVSIVALPLVACYGVGGLIGVVGAILGHVARRQIRNNKDSGDGMAIAGIVIGWISLVLGVVVLGFIVAFFVYAINNAPSSTHNSGTGLYNTLRAALT
jgi:hypothetical protein